jgi:hypothetical protein
MNAPAKAKDGAPAPSEAATAKVDEPEGSAVAGEATTPASGEDKGEAKKVVPTTWQGWSCDGCRVR